MSATTDGRSARWEGHRQERRRQLVESAIRTIRSRGATVGMDELAAEAGTSKTVFYRHFADRHGLYQAVAERVDELILRDIGTVLGASTKGGGLSALDLDPRSVIHAAIDAYLRLVERDPELYRFIVSAPIVGTERSGDSAQAVADRRSDQPARLGGPRRPGQRPRAREPVGTVPRRARPCRCRRLAGGPRR